MKLGVNLSFLRIKHRRKDTNCKECKVGRMQATPGAAPENVASENAAPENGEPATVTVVLDEVTAIGDSVKYRKTDVIERYAEGKFAAGASLFYLQATVVYFFLVLCGSFPLWWVCEGTEVPIERSNMMFNQTNTTIVSNCDEFAESAQILYTPSTLLVVFMFGVLVPKQIRKADDLKKSVLDHYDSIYILRRVGLIARTYNNEEIGGYMDELVQCYTDLVMSSICLAAIISRRQFMKHELVSPLRLLQHWWSQKIHPTLDNEGNAVKIDRLKRDEDENDLIEKQMDFLSILYVEVHRKANNGGNPASHGVPLNGNTPLSAVLEMTAVGQSTFDTRALLLFFAALTAVCGFAQKLGDDGRMDVSTAWVHIMSNYVMIVVPYCLLSPFVFREDIFKERCPFIPTDEEKAAWDQKLKDTHPDNRARMKAERAHSLDKRGLVRKDLAIFSVRGNPTFKAEGLKRNSTYAATSMWSPFTRYRKDFEI